MKKILSVLLCAAMLVGGLVFAAFAEDVVDKAMLYDDISVEDPSITGGMGYIVNSHRKNDYGVTAFNSEDAYAVQDKNGISIAFDLNVIATSQCTHLVNTLFPNDYRHVQGLVFTFSCYDGRQAIIYDAAKQEFQIANVGWPTSVVKVDGSSVIESRKVKMEPGDWHRCFYLIQGTEVFVYFDGTQILYHDFNGGPNNNLTREFLMFWPSHCRLMIDNMIVGTDEYDDTLGETFEEKIAANYKPEADIKNILFADDFNDAVDVSVDHVVKDVPTWAVEKDDKGNTVYVDELDEEGNPVLDEDGKVKQTTVPAYEKNEDGSYKLDEEGNKIRVQELDDKGNPAVHDEYFFKVGDEVKPGPEQEHAGFTWGAGLSHGPNIPCYGVEKAKYSGSVKDAADAVISFADTGATEGSTVNVAITYDPTNAGFTSAKKLCLALDPLFNFKGFDNVADGASIEADENGLVNITLPDGFSGKIADLVLEIPAEKEMAQSCRYRYGFTVLPETEFVNGADAVDADKITIDGGFTSTQNFVKGDADGNGKINAKDVILMMKYNLVQTDISRGKTPTAAQQAIIDAVKVKAADVYPDEKINARDVKVLMKYIVDPSKGWGTK